MVCSNVLIQLNYTAGNYMVRAANWLMHSILHHLTHWLRANHAIVWGRIYSTRQPEKRSWWRWCPRIVILNWTHLRQFNLCTVYSDSRIVWSRVLDIFCVARRERDRIIRPFIRNEPFTCVEFRLEERRVGHLHKLGGIHNYVKQFIKHAIMHIINYLWKNIDNTNYRNKGH